MQVVACYDNMDVLNALMPEFYDLDWLMKTTDTKGLMYGKQKFPWPLCHRELYYHVTGVQDYTNKGIITVSKSKLAGEKYHGVEVQPETNDYVRIIVQKGFNYFLYLGPNKTRHIAIWNVNP
jgi:hypothetical protein